MSCIAGPSTRRTGFRRLPRTLRAWQREGAPATGLAGSRPNDDGGSRARGEKPPVGPRGPTQRRPSPLMAALGGQPPCPVHGAAAPSRHGLEGPSRSGARPAVDAGRGSRRVPPHPGARPSRSSSGGSRSPRPSLLSEGNGYRCSPSWPVRWTTAASTTATWQRSPRHCEPSWLPIVDARGCGTGDPEDPPACGDSPYGVRSPARTSDRPAVLQSSCALEAAAGQPPVIPDRRAGSPRPRGADEPEVSSSPVWRVRAGVVSPGDGPETGDAASSA